MSNRYPFRDRWVVPNPEPCTLDHKPKTTNPKASVRNQIYDMHEFSLTNIRPSNAFKPTKFPAMMNRPVLVFQGEAFETDPKVCVPLTAAERGRNTILKDFKKSLDSLRNWTFTLKKPGSDSLEMCVICSTAGV